MRQCQPVIIVLQVTAARSRTALASQFNRCEYRLIRNRAEAIGILPDNFYRIPAVRFIEQHTEQRRDVSPLLVGLHGTLCKNSVVRMLDQNQTQQDLVEIEAGHCLTARSQAQRLTAKDVFGHQAYRDTHRVDDWSAIGHARIRTKVAECGTRRFRLRPAEGVMLYLLPPAQLRLAGQPP